MSLTGNQDNTATALHSFDPNSFPSTVDKHYQMVTMFDGNVHPFPGYRICVAHKGCIVAQGPAHLAFYMAMDLMFHFTAYAVETESWRAWTDGDAPRCQGRFMAVHRGQTNR